MDSVCVCRFMVIYQTERSISFVHSIFSILYKIKSKEADSYPTSYCGSICNDISTINIMGCQGVIWS